MDSSNYHILYASRRALEDTVVRASASPKGLADEAGKLGSADLGKNVETLLQYGDGESDQPSASIPWVFLGVCS